MRLALCDIQALLRVHYDPAYVPEFRMVRVLLEHGLVRAMGSGQVQTTERAGVYIEAIRKLPLPERVEEWRMPK